MKAQDFPTQAEAEAHAKALGLNTYGIIVWTNKNREKRYTVMKYRKPKTGRKGGR